MNVYKASVLVELVITAESSSDALKVISHNVFEKLDGMNIKVQSCSRVENVHQLPDGWTGNELAFMAANAKSIDEQKISWHLKNPST